MTVCGSFRFPNTVDWGECATDALFHAIETTNGRNYTSLGLTKLCPQPEIQSRLRAWGGDRSNFPGTLCTGRDTIKLPAINARKEE
jgi:hypothetical protein